MKRAIITSIGLLTPSLCLGQVGLKSVPAGWYHGDRITIPSHGFSFQSPPGWNWSYFVSPPGSITLVGLSAGGERLLISAYGREGAGEPAEAIQHILRGLRDGLPPGWTVGEPRITAAAIPSPGSSRFVAPISTPGGQESYFTGYLGPGRPSLLLYAPSRNPNDPASLASVVRSIRSVADPATAAGASAAAVIGIGLTLAACGVLALVGELAAFGRRAHGEGMPPLARLLTYAGAAGAAFLTQVDLSDPIQGTAGYAFGRVLFVLIAAAIVAYVAFGRAAHRNWTRFALLFCGASVVLPLVLDTMRALNAR